MNTARKRIPMSIPRRKLEVPEITGFRLYWFADRNVEYAIQGGYEFVDSKDVSLNQSGVANSLGVSGNADLGSRVRVIGGTAEGGGVEYLTLMKIPMEYYLEDQKALEERNASILSVIFRDEKILGSEGVAPEDRGVRYVKKALFQRPVRKG